MALPVGTYVYEAGYRGRLSSDTNPPDFYVILAVVGTDAFGNSTTAFLGPMTPAASTALGMTPAGAAATVLNGIQSQMTAVNSALAAYNAALATYTGPPVFLTLTYPTGVFVQEFLYRGQSAGGSDWSVVLCQYTTDLMGNPIMARAGPMIPAKAAGAPYNQTLTTAIASINAAIQLQINSLNAATAAL